MAEPHEVSARLQQILQGEDPLGVVVRSHVYIERLLNEYIETVVPSPKHLEKAGLEYWQKVALATALGLDPELSSALQCLGTLRNRFAHTEKDQLTDDDSKNLQKAMPSIAKEAFSSAFRGSKKVVPDTLPENERDLEPKDRFILCILTLRVPLLLAIEQVQNEIHD
jgi:hypothetical protein